MKKVNFKKVKYFLTILLVGLVVFGVWSYLKSNEPIDIGHPQKGDFVKVGQMSVPRYNHQAVLLDDGTVLVFGGKTVKDGSEGLTNTAEIYNPITKQFTPVGNMKEHREEFTTTKLNNGKIFITGGISKKVSNGGSGLKFYHNRSLKSTEFYNPKTKKFEQGPDMNVTRMRHTSTLLKSGKVLITGGEELDTGRKQLPLGWHVLKCEIYDPITNNFVLISELKIPRVKHSAILLKDGRVLVVGGVGKEPKYKFLSSVEVYNPKNNNFKIIGSIRTPKSFINLYSLKDGNILITDGLGEKSNVYTYVWFKDIEEFNSKTNEIMFLGTRTLTGEYPGEVLLNNDTLLFTGGSNGVGLSSWWYKSSEIFDPKTKKFTQGNDMNFLRTGHKATLLKDGNGLITGGYGTGRTAELYINK